MRSESTTLRYPVELISDRLYQLGDVTPIDTRLSWRAPGAEGLEPINCFLLCDGPFVLLIETGVASHRQVILDQLGSLSSGRRRLECVAVTRVEADCLSNLSDVIRHHEARRVYAPGGMSPRDFFDDLNAESLVRTLGHDIDVALARHGDVHEISGNITLHVVRPSLRVLPTVWYYVPELRTLFCSDLFSHEVIESGSPASYVTASDPSYEAMRSHLLAKFDWLKSAHRDEIVQEIGSIFGELDVDILAPTHGAPIVGSEAVRARVDCLLSILRSSLR